MGRPARTEEEDVDLSIFATPEAWISLLTLIFLEIVLGVDNLVFISITTNRLPPEKQHIGRKLGLAGALVMRILFLCFASYLVHMTASLFTVNLGAYSHGFSVRDIVMLVGGGYLIYKGISELIDVLALRQKDAGEREQACRLKAGEHGRAVANDRGFKRLLGDLARHGPPLVACKLDRDNLNESNVSVKKKVR